MEDVIVILILAFVIAAVVLYLFSAKKRGQKCIGCPYSGKGKCNCKENEINN